MPVPIQNLRSAVSNKRPVATGLAVGQIAVNYNESDPAIYLRGNADALIKVSPTYVGSTAPNATPASGGASGNAKGETWLDTSTSPASFKIWNGSSWVAGYTLASGTTIQNPTLVNATLSGSVTLPSGSITSNAIANGAIVDEDISASAAISLSKLATGTLPSGVQVNSANIANGSIVDIDISASAAIAGSKISPAFGGQFVTTSSGVDLLQQADVRFFDADSSNFVAFQGASNITSNLVWTLPSTDGASGQFLSTNGTGTLAWASGLSASAANTFTAVQTFSSGISLNNADITNIDTATFNSQVSLGSSSGSITVNWRTGQNQRQPEPTGTITYTFTAPNGPCHLQLLIDSDGSSTAQTINWPGSVIWLNSVWAGTNNKRAVINFWYDGTNYFAIGTNQA